MKKLTGILLVLAMILSMTVCFTGCDIDIIIDKDGEDDTNNNNSTMKEIVKYEVNEKGELIATYSDGTVVNLGVVVGGTVDDLNNNNNNNNNNNGDNNDDNNDNDPYEKDDLPNTLNYGGETVTMLYWSDHLHKDEFEITEPSDDIVTNASYKRNRTVEQRLNIKFDYASTKGNTNNTAQFVQFLNRDIASGACEYDIFGCYGLTTASCATSGLCMDLKQFDYINFDKPWWPEALTEEATIYNKLYFASGDIATSYLYEMYMMFYNTDMITEYKFATDPLDYALAGTWTWDKFYDYCAAVGANDANVNGEVDGNDKYGFIAEIGTLCPIFFSADLRMFSHDKNGGISVAEECFSNKADTFIADFNNFLYSSGTALYYELVDHKVKDFFANSNTLFMINRATVAKTTLAITEGLNYGILPMPKYDEAQEEYVSTLANGFSLYGMSIGVASEIRRDEMCAAVLECLASESYRQISPVLFETVMKLRYSPNAQSSQVYDIVRSTVQFDLSRIFHKALESIPQSLFKNTIRDNKSWGAQATSATRRLNSLIEEVIMSAFTS